MYFTTVFQVLNLSLYKLKYSCNLKDIECLKCIICIECFVLQHVSRSPERKSEVNNNQPDEQSLWNVSQHIDNGPNDNQQVQSSINKSDYWLEQGHTSPDEAEHSFPRKYDSTPKKSGTSYYAGNTDAPLCLWQEPMFDLSYIADVTDQLSVGEAHYKACQRNSPPASERQPSVDENDASGHKIDTVRPENLVAKVRYRRSQSDGRRACTEMHDCMFSHTCECNNLLCCHSSANPYLHEL
jgi:hypothetical protein